jgi:enoyl-CoA hydratase/carnithine racemase
MIDWSYKDGICELRLGREPLNEIGSEWLEALERFLSEIDYSRAGALLIYSTLSRGFCAGADLRELYAGMCKRPAEQHLPAVSEFLARVQRVMDRLDTLPLTTVGAVSGLCFGGGFELALTCDLLVADRTARFCFPELRLGLIPAFGGVPRLRRELPAGVVRDLLLTGRSINARKAFELGLVSQLVAPGEALPVARRVAGQAALLEREAAAAAKSLVKPIAEEELAGEREHFLRLFQHPRVKEALGRFVSSRDPMPYLPQGMKGEG